MYKPEGLESAQDTPTPSSRHQGDLFTSEGQRQGIDKGEGRKGARELEGVEGYLPWRDKGLLWIERRHMRWPVSIWRLIKGQEESLCEHELVLLGHAN